MFRLPVATAPGPSFQTEWSDDALRAATYPDPTPPGWYVAASADELKPGDIRAFRLGEHRLVLFRSDAAPYSVSALDAYCPHLGADLAGGKVERGGLVCPFHQWKYSGDGRVCEIPYADRIPRGLKTGSWIVEEHYGLLWVWYDRDEHGRKSPRYALPEIPAHMVERGRRDGGTIPMHLLEIIENGADARHFDVVHRKMLVPHSRTAIPGVTLDYHLAQWSPDPTDPYVSHLNVESSVTVLGRPIERSRGGGHVRFVGPGTLLLLDITIPGVGNVIIVQSHTPEAPLRQRVRFRWFADKKLPSALVWWLAGAWMGQVQEDFAIWASKVHVKKPMLVAGDGPVLAMRLLVP